MEQNKPKCGFLVRKDYEGQKDFDDVYKEVTLKQKVKKIGPGDEDFIIELVEEVSEIPIQEVLDSQKDDVGIEAYMRPYQLSGEPLPNVVVSDEVQDFTEFPDDPIDALKVGDDMMKAFNSLDPSLRGNAKNPEEFLANLTQEKFESWLKSKVNVEKVSDLDVKEK